MEEHIHIDNTSDIGPTEGEQRGALADLETRVRTLAEIVGLPLDDDQVPALAFAFDAAMEMVQDLDAIADATGLTVAGPYDAAWPEEVRR